MSIEAPGLIPLVSYVRQTLGARRYGGVIGDGEHLYGYHLGKDRIFCDVGLGWDDYSVQTRRDRQALTDFACAIDIGNDWPLHSKWLRWLVNQCRQGKYSDIREIIGTLDGVNVVGWDAENKWRTEPDRGDETHLWHTHISFYRDACRRDQSYVLHHFFDPPKKIKPMPSVAASPTGMPRVISKMEHVHSPVPEKNLVGVGPLFKVTAVGLLQLAVWWVIRRRMVVAREDSE